MKIDNSVIFDTANLNNIIELIDFEELRKNHRIELKEKSDDTLKKEHVQINYLWSTDDNTNILPFSANITVEEDYDSIAEPFVMHIELTPAELMDVITEYFSWNDVPYEAIGIINCEKNDGKATVTGVQDFGSITVYVKKLETKNKRKKLAN